MDKDGVSAVNNSARSNSFTLTYNRTASYYSNFPFLIFSDESLVYEEINRVINCTLDISKKKKATPLLASMAMFRAIDKTNVVLPIPGRAAMIIKSEGCHPEVNASNL